MWLSLGSNSLLISSNFSVLNNILFSYKFLRITHIIGIIQIRIYWFVKWTNFWKKLFFKWNLNLLSVEIRSEHLLPKFKLGRNINSHILIADIFNSKMLHWIIYTHVFNGFYSIISHPLLTILHVTLNQTSVVS